MLQSCSDDLCDIVAVLAVIDWSAMLLSAKRMQPSSLVYSVLTTHQASQFHTGNHFTSRETVSALNKMRSFTVKRYRLLISTIITELYVGTVTIIVESHNH